MSRAVRKAMDERGLTQAQLAHSLGMSQPNLSQRLTQRRRWSIDDLARLVELGIIDPVVLWEQS